MHFSSAALLLTTALSGASAHPGHRHDHLHARHHHLVPRDPLLFVADNKPQNQEPTETSTGETSQTSETAEPASTENSANTTGDGSSSGDTATTGTGVKQPFCNGEPTNVKRATEYDIAYKGNTGSATTWGCNIMEVDCSSVDLYDYATVFEGNPSGSHDAYSCAAFNKIGPTGQIDGCWHSALDFTVAKGEQKCIVFDKNSQGSISCGPGANGPEKTSLGQWAGTWYEFDCGSDKNDDQSGSDVSVLVANQYGLSYIGMAIEAPGKGMCSWLKATGENYQAYMGGMEALDGVGCTGYSTGQVKVTLGY